VLTLEFVARQPRLDSPPAGRGAPPARRSRAAGWGRSVGSAVNLPAATYLR